MENFATFELKILLNSIVHDFAKEQNTEEEKALAVGMAEKAKEVVAAGSEIFHGNLPDGAKDNRSFVRHSRKRVSGNRKKV